jgi:hypothetical protein
MRVYFRTKESEHLQRLLLTWWSYAIVIEANWTRVRANGLDASSASIRIPIGYIRRLKFDHLGCALRHARDVLRPWRNDMNLRNSWFEVLVYPNTAP